MAPVSLKLHIYKDGSKETRRFSLEDPSLRDVLQRIVTDWGLSAPMLHYADEDGDEITMTTESEWAECLRLSKQPVVLYVRAGRSPLPQPLEQHADPVPAELERIAAEEKARVEAEEKEKARVAEEKARMEAEEKARAEAEEKALVEAERRGREEKARMEAEEKALVEAMEKARVEAEEKARQEAEERARVAEEKARMEAEEKARIEAEKARAEAEEKARIEAEKARIEAEEKARIEAEKARIAAEEKARLGGLGTPLTGGQGTPLTREPTVLSSTRTSSESHTVASATLKWVLEQYYGKDIIERIMGGEAPPAEAFFSVKVLDGPSSLDLHVNLQQCVKLMQRKIAELLTQGDVATAEEWCLHAEEMLPADEAVQYNLACIRCRQGKITEAINRLRKAKELGFHNVEHIESDPDLVPLHGYQGYKALIVSMKDSRRSHEPEQPQQAPPVVEPERPGPHAAAIQKLRAMGLQFNEADICGLLDAGVSLESIIPQLVKP